MANPFLPDVTRWMRDAFRLEEPAIPVRLETDLVQPVADVVQGGWNEADWRHVAIDQAASTGQTQYTQVSRPIDSRPFGSLITALRFQLVAGAAPVNMKLRFLPLAATETPAFVDRAVAVDQILDTNILLAGGPLWVPPNCGFQFLIDATGVGQTANIRCIYGRIRAGMKCL